MTWRERVRPASFKGVRFWVDGASVSQGRRVSVRRFAGRDGSAQQDLGRDPVELDVSGYVFGDDYDILRDELEHALTEGGAGWLSLPSRGNLWVRVTRGPQTAESRDAGGFCTVRFSCVVEQRELPRPYARRDTRAELGASADAAREAAASDFAERVSTRGMPGAYLEPARAVVNQALDLAGAVQVRAAELMAPAAEASRALDAVRDRASTLLSTPSQAATLLVDVVTSAFALSDAVIGGVDALSGVPVALTSPFEAGRGARMLDAIQGAFRGFGGERPSRGTSALAARADDTAREVSTLVRVAALSAASRGYVEVRFDSSALALGVLARTTAELDELALVATDRVYQALERLRAALTAHLLETASRLPELVAYRVPGPMPALLVSYALYGSLAMEPDLIARNRLADPLRAAGTLEVIAP